MFCVIIQAESLKSAKSYCITEPITCGHCLRTKWYHLCRYMCSARSHICWQPFLWYCRKKSKTSDKMATLDKLDLLIDLSPFGSSLMFSETNSELLSKVRCMRLWNHILVISPCSVSLESVVHKSDCKGSRQCLHVFVFYSPWLSLLLAMYTNFCLV